MKEKEKNEKRESGSWGISTCVSVQTVLWHGKHLLVMSGAELEACSKPFTFTAGWHNALSAAGIARCLSHKGMIKERWYLAAPLSSRFPQLTVASVGGSPLLFLLL